MAGESLWGLYKQFEGIDPATEVPASLDAHRATKTDDGFAHCETCGGIWFTATISYRSDGSPIGTLAPSTCVGCGALRVV